VKRHTCADHDVDTAQVFIYGKLASGGSKFDAFFQRIKLDERHRSLATARNVDSGDSRVLIFITGTGLP
jgi:hypothetical protein